MATDKQIAANQANAKLSHGPVTPEGKAAVSQNRTTHGLNYNPETFRVLDCESQADYNILVDHLEREQRPAELAEKLIVAAMAQHRWLSERALRLQETCFDQQSGQIKDTKMFSLYLRYQTTNERAYHKCLGDLIKLRFDRERFRIGIESEQRRQDRHESWKENDFMERAIKEMKAVSLGGQLAREKKVAEMAAKAEKAFNRLQLSRSTYACARSVFIAR